MIMKIPTSPVGNGCYEPYDFDDEYDVPSDGENDNDFSEYLWMENEEEFDKMEMQRLEEEELMKQCLEAMLEDEYEAQIAARKDDMTAESLTTAGTEEQLCDVLSSLSVSVVNVENSKLNPLAAEFVPTFSSFVAPTST